MTSVTKYDMQACLAMGFGRIVVMMYDPISDR